MKKFLFILLLCMSTAYGSHICVEGRFGGFYFTSNSVEKVYPGWDFGFGVAAGFSSCGFFELVLQYGFAKKDGQGYLTGQLPTISGTNLYQTHSTRVVYQNFDVLIKAYYPVCDWMKPYVGIGPRALFLDIDNQSPYVRQHVCKTYAGGVVAGGIHFSGCFWYINPFVEYGFVPTSLSTNKSSFTYNANFDNLFVGAAVGFCY